MSEEKEKEQHINFPGNLIGPNGINIPKLKIKLRLHKLSRRSCELLGLDYEKMKEKLRKN